MVSLSNPERVNAYLKDKQLLDVFVFLVLSVDDLRNRGNLLSKDIANLNHGLQQIMQKITENPDISPINKEISQQFKDIHYLELETIQRTSIFIELLAVYYHIMRNNIQDLPRAISVNDKVPLYSEFEYFNNQTSEDIKKNFKFPEVNNFSELTSAEKKELKEMLEESALDMLECFKDVYRFNSHFRPIYTKYKHMMSEFTGLYGVDKERHNITSHVYVRQKDVDKKNVPHYSVSIVPLNAEIIQYFDKIARSVYTLLAFLIDNQLLSFANEGKDFIPRNLILPEKCNKPRFQQIVDKITNYCVPNLQTVMKVNPSPDRELQNKIDETLKTEFIYTMKKDIFDVEFLKDSQITRTDNSKKPDETLKVYENFENVDIAKASESWSTYKLTDGTILKIRDVLGKAIKLPSFDEAGNPIFSLKTQTVSISFPPKSIRGIESAPFTQEELSKSITSPNMNFETIQEPWNNYLLTDGTNIDIKAVLCTVSQTNKYDHYGEPIYLTTRKLDIKMIPPNR